MATIVHHIDTKQIRLVFRMPRSFGLRMWLMIGLLRLAGLVSPVTIDVSVDRAD